ncbi:IS4 family transposase [Novipirellula sp. SH528]|uniref:IS4 family transposase n=1 Tax=Novipirellula sp. SH528 TaxID=3454466 RepID=UPI003F9EFA0F
MNAIPTTIEQEFNTIDFGHKSRNDRSKAILKALFANPQESINAACDKWKDAKGAYRFLQNSQVDSDEILSAHRRATIQRIKFQKVVCVAQDTTELDFGNHAPDDVRCLNQAERRGLYDHSSVVFTPEKLCLGVLDVDFFDRSEESLGNAAERKTDPIEDKESFRWLQGYRRCCQLASQCPQTQIVSLADREGDIYDIFVEAEKHECPADFVIRSKQVRSLPEKDEQAGGNTYKKMREEVENSNLVTTRQIELPATAKRAARTATLEIRAIRTKMKPPHARSALPEVTLSVVLVQEVGGPGDGTDLNWLLLSSLPIDNYQDVLRIVDYYVARWPVEMFFRVYKSGCRVEDIMLETKSRLIRALMFYKVVAWRILFVTFLGRECPELPSDVVFSEAEWKSVWKIVEETEPPKSAPELSQFIPMLAQLGGYNRRKHDGPPGMETIWRGTRRMMDFALAWRSFGPPVSAEH